MHNLGTLLIGLGLGVFGVIPPGLLNVTAAKITVNDGKNRSMIFAIGVCVIIIIQAFIAVLFARYLSNHPSVVAILKEIAAAIFILISIYFFVIASKPPKKPSENNSVKSKGNRFFQGVLMSSLNMFPIPFHAYMSLTLASIGWLQFNSASMLSYAIGVTLGSFIMLYLYIHFFNKLEGKWYTSYKAMNYFIGSITAIVGIITLLSLLK